MNYGELRTLFIGQLNRDDCTTALADGFLSQAISRVHRTLRVQTMERESTLTLDASGACLIPGDYLQMKDGIWWNNKHKLKRLTFEEWVAYSGSGDPGVYCRRVNKWWIKPNPGVDTTNFNVSYFGEIEPLVEPEDEDPLLNIASDLFLYGALVFAADYFSDDRRDTFENRFQQILGELSTQAGEQEMSEGTNVVSSGRDEEY